jgi:phosphotriesterase-related protein
MAVVETVRGPIDTTALGRVLMHEHVFVLGAEFRQNYPGFPDQWDEQACIDDAVQKLRDLKSRGIDTILDPTVIGLGRYIPRIQRVNGQVDINIVAATGIYSYNDAPFQFHYTGPGLLFDVAEPMVELFFKDIREGIADTGVKAALLKCAIDEPGLTDGVERVMRAVGQAHVETGAPITVHTNPHTQSGLVAQKVREQVGLDFLLPFDARVDTVAVLAKHGYAEQMVLAHDAACYFDWFEAEAVAAAVPNWNCNHISDDVLPALRERGVSEDQITTMLVDNPRCYFEVTK